MKPQETIKRKKIGIYNLQENGTDIWRKIKKCYMVIKNDI